MKTELDIWLALQNGKSLTINDIAKIAFNIDVSSYIETVDDIELPRFRNNHVRCDGTALLTLSSLYEMILPIINMQAYNKEKGDPSGMEKGIKYKCSPISYECVFDESKKLSQLDKFGIRYDSEFIY